MVEHEDYERALEVRSRFRDCLNSKANGKELYKAAKLKQVNYLGSGRRRIPAMLLTARLFGFNCRYLLSP